MAAYRCRVQAANKMKLELGLSQDLNASDAVAAGAEILGVTFESVEGGKTLTLKERVAVLCQEAVSFHDYRKRALLSCATTNRGFIYAGASLVRIQGIDLGWDQAAVQPTAPVSAPPPVTSESAGDDDDEDDDDEGQESAVALARLVPILGDLSGGYSGADIKMLCRDAAMAPMRRAIAGKSPDDIRRMKESGEVSARTRAQSF